MDFDYSIDAPVSTHWSLRPLKALPAKGLAHIAQALSINRKTEQGMSQIDSMTMEARKRFGNVARFG